MQNAPTARIAVEIAARFIHIHNPGLAITITPHKSRGEELVSIDPASGEELGETIKNKVSQDAAALLRSISEQRGRPSQELELTVTEAKSYTSMEALESGIIDVISKNQDDDHYSLRFPRFLSFRGFAKGEKV